MSRLDSLSQEELNKLYVRSAYLYQPGILQLFGIIIGTVSEVNESKYDLSDYAVIEPGVNVRELEDVFVITDFDGQGIEEKVD